MRRPASSTARCSTDELTRLGISDPTQGRSGSGGADSKVAVHLRDQKALVHLEAEEEERGVESWVLDMGTTNHMSSSRVAFAELDTAVCGTVRFGDDSVAWIEGCGTVIF